MRKTPRKSAENTDSPPTLTKSCGCHFGQSADLRTSSVAQESADTEGRKPLTADGL